MAIIQGWADLPPPGTRLESKRVGTNRVNRLSSKQKDYLISFETPCSMGKVIYLKRYWHKSNMIFKKFAKISYIHSKSIRIINLIWHFRKKVNTIKIIKRSIQIVSQPIWLLLYYIYRQLNIIKQRMHSLVTKCNIHFRILNILKYIRAIS